LHYVLQHDSQYVLVQKAQMSWPRVFLLPQLKTQQTTIPRD
jgi:hypothetical protein